MKADLEIKVVAKMRGLWKLAFLTFLMRWKSSRHEVHVHLHDGKQVVCLTHATAPVAAAEQQKPPSMTGQR